MTSLETVDNAALANVGISWKGKCACETLLVWKDITRTDNANGDAGFNVILSAVVGQKVHQCRRTDAFIRGSEQLLVARLHGRSHMSLRTDRLVQRQSTVGMTHQTVALILSRGTKSDGGEFVAEILQPLVEVIAWNEI